MEYYTWVLAFHVMSVISWMAMLFYMPRLFIYHVEHAKNGPAFTDVIKIQEEKLWRIIGNPAMIASLLSGLLMIYLNPDLFKGGAWLHVKLTAVLVLLVYHYFLGVFRQKLARESCTKSGKFFRIFNEVPTLLMMLIVIMVVIKPF
jgi:putative membrane protein